MNDTNFMEKLQQGIRTAFEDRTVISDEEYRPQFVFNNFREGRKVLNSLERELKYYEKHFINKTIFCNCDDVTNSNFYNYFVENFNRLGIKKLISKK